MTFIDPALITGFSLALFFFGSAWFYAWRQELAATRRRLQAAKTARAPLPLRFVAVEGGGATCRDPDAELYLPLARAA
ncbi:MAG: hypothetical protein AAFO70_00055 [Pseudomonadota bacterium]